MAAPPSTDACKAAQAALFVRLVEALPQALHRRREGGCTLAAVTDVLAAMRKLVAGGHKAHQALFRWIPCAMCPVSYRRRALRHGPIGKNISQ